MPKPSLDHTTDDTAGHVVHLLERFDVLTSAPQSLLRPTHLGMRGRVIFAFVNVIVTIAAVVSLYFLWWSEESPGWWFNLIFTVMIGGISVALWAILIGTGEEAKFDRAMQAKWDESRHYSAPSRAACSRGTSA